MHQRFPGCHQTVQEVLGHLSKKNTEDADSLQLVITVASVPFNIVFIVPIVIISILINMLIRVFPGNCMFNARRDFRESRQVSTAATTASDVLVFESLAAGAASPHCVLKASARGADFQLLPTLSPCTFVTHLKSDLKFPPVRCLECFRAESPS